MPLPQCIAADDHPVRWRPAGRPNTGSGRSGADVCSPTLRVGRQASTVDTLIDRNPVSVCPQPGCGPSLDDNPSSVRRKGRLHTMTATRSGPGPRCRHCTHLQSKIAEGVWLLAAGWLPSLARGRLLGGALSSQGVHSRLCYSSGNHGHDPQSGVSITPGGGTLRPDGAQALAWRGCSGAVLRHVLTVAPLGAARLPRQV